MKHIRAAKIVILDGEGKALLLRRSHTHPTDGLMPDIPGGTIEDGETIEAGLIREIREETGLDLLEGDVTLFHSVAFHGIPDVTIDCRVYAARLTEVAPAVIISWEHDEYSWVSISELKGLERPYQEGVDYATAHNLWSSV
ncbi:MAG: hydrolase [Candidatus Saccharibacteria bacterium]|nr:hydrolase [Candidatus Saccharibacteria bacterium]